MADNVDITPGVGATVATDDVGGVQYQRVKTGYGVDGAYADVAAGAGLPVAAAYMEVSGSGAAANADVIASTDVRSYAYATLQVTGSWSGIISVQGSNDATNWIALPYAQPANATVTSANIQSNGLYMVARVTRYMRVRITNWFSGTSAVANLQLFSHGGYGFTAINGVTPYGVTTGNQNLPTGDAASGTVSGYFAGTMAFNGTNWDRVRNVTAVDGTGSTGLLAAGLIGHDPVAAVNRRIKCDAVGALHVREAVAVAAALSNVTAATSSTTLLAANVARRRVILVNDSTATLFLAYAATASATAYTYKIGAGYTWEMPDPAYVGLLTGIWDAVNGTARVTEVT